MELVLGGLNNVRGSRAQGLSLVVWCLDLSGCGRGMESERPTVELGDVGSGVVGLPWEGTRNLPVPRGAVCPGSARPRCPSTERKQAMVDAVV